MGKKKAREKARTEMHEDILAKELAPLPALPPSIDLSLERMRTIIYPDRSIEGGSGGSGANLLLELAEPKGFSQP